MFHKEMPLMPGKRCGVCGGQSIVDLFRIKDARYKNLDIHLSKCMNCGVGHTEYPAPGELPADFFNYTENYYSYSLGGYSSVRLRLKTVFYKYLFLPFFGTIAERWLTIIPPRRHGKVLDVGCGCGASLDIWARLGWKTYGTEVTSRPIEICRANGHEVFETKSPAEVFEESFFDWIVLDNVLEHVENPQVLLKQLARLLKCDGALTICVPNFGGEGAEEFGPYWDALLPEQHIFQYTESGLSLLLKECGYAIRHVAYQPRFQSIPRMNNVRACGDAETYERLERYLKRLEMRKFIHLLTAPRIAERYGYFMTVTAKHASCDAP